MPKIDFSEVGAAANRRRQAQAAAATCAQVQAALQHLPDDVPRHLVDAGRLRLAHPDLSLRELGRLADPPLTKDAIASRLRRLQLRATHAR